MSIVEKEERYLQLLRRFMLNFAQVTLVLFSLSLLIAAGSFFYSRYLDSRPLQLPSSSTLHEVIDPCAFLTNSESESNGITAHGIPVPVKQVLRTCELMIAPVSDYTTEAAAFDGFVNAVVEAVTVNGLVYDIEADARRGLDDDARQWVADALEPVNLLDSNVLSAEAQESLRLQFANIIASYGEALKTILHVDAPYTDDFLTAYDHALQGDYLSNQLAVSLYEAIESYDASQARAEVSRAVTFPALYTALTFFMMFVSLMLAFVFIKIEINLRDIRDSLRSATSAPANPEDGSVSETSITSLFGKEGPTGSGLA